VQVALDAAEAGGQHALYIKLSNNMGAVLRKQELHEEVGTFKLTCRTDLLDRHRSTPCSCDSENIPAITAQLAILSHD
jgi:hypothetical protein